MKMRQTMRASVAVLALVMLPNCATPLQKARSENQLLTHHVDQLRAERREQDRKLLDLQRQMQMLQVAQSQSTPTRTVESGAHSVDSTPQLAVTVMAPLSGEDGLVGDSDLGSGTGRVVGVSDDGTEIVYQQDAMLTAPDMERTSGRLAAGTDLRSTEVRRASTSKRSSSRSMTTTPSVQALAASSGASRQARSGVTTTTATPNAARPSLMLTNGAVVAARVRAPLRPLRAPDKNLDEASRYREAIALLRRGDHAASITMLRTFIADNPHHDYADNAQYWLGEAFYDQKDYSNALVEFRAAIDKFPQGNKVPDSMLKVGYCYFAMGDASRALATLQQLIASYPKSEPASLAMKRLESK